MWTKKLLIVISLFAFQGCAMMQEPVNTGSAVPDTVFVRVWDMPPAEKMSMVPDFDETSDDVPPKLTVASWAAFYGIPCSSTGEFIEFGFDSATTGTAPNHYDIEIRGRISAIGAPPENMVGIREYFTVFSEQVYSDWFIARIRGVDIENRVGPWSEWADIRADTTSTEAE